jgi:hypothetical protein
MCGETSRETGDYVAKKVDHRAVLRAFTAIDDAGATPRAEGRSVAITARGCRGVEWGHDFRVDRFQKATTSVRPADGFAKWTCHAVEHAYSQRGLVARAKEGDP